MAQDQTDRTVIFLHIPKTGGTSLGFYLRDQYPTNQIYQIDHLSAIDRLKKLRKWQREKIRLILGHAEFGLHALFSRKVVYVTILRHPVARVISFYQHVLRNGEHILHKHAKSGMNVVDFALSTLTPEVDNLQVRMLTGTNFSVPINRLTDDHVQNAVNNLERHFTVVGIQERMPVFIDTLAKEFGYRRGGMPSANISPNDMRSSNLSADEFNAILARNRLDAMLYHHVLRRHARQS